MMIVFLTTRVKELTNENWGKLMRILEHLYCTRDLVLSLSNGGFNILKWYVNVSHQVSQTLEVTLVQH